MHPVSGAGGQLPADSRERLVKEVAVDADKASQAFSPG